MRAGVSFISPSSRPPLPLRELLIDLFPSEKKLSWWEYFSSDLASVCSMRGEWKSKLISRLEWALRWPSSDPRGVLIRRASYKTINQVLCIYLRRDVSYLLKVGRWAALVEKSALKGISQKHTQKHTQNENFLFGSLRLSRLLADWSVYCRSSLGVAAGVLPISNLCTELVAEVTDIIEPCDFLRCHGASPNPRWGLWLVAATPGDHSDAG